MRSPRPAITASRSRSSRGGRVVGACTANASSSRSSVTPGAHGRAARQLTSPWCHRSLATETAGIIATAKSTPPRSAGPATLAHSAVV